MNQNNKAIKIGNLITELHNVLNRSYQDKNERNKAIHDIVTEIYERGHFDGFTQAEIYYDVLKDFVDDESYDVESFNIDNLNF